MPAAKFNLPPAVRGDSFGPITIGPITSSEPFPDLEEAEVSMTFRKNKATSSATQILKKSEGQIETTSDTISVLRFRPMESGCLVWDIEIQWPNGETLTIAKNDKPWLVELDVTRPERAT